MLYWWFFDHLWDDTIVFVNSKVNNECSIALSRDTFWKEEFCGRIELTEQDVRRADFIDRYIDMCKKQMPFIHFIAESVSLAL